MPEGTVRRITRMIAGLLVPVVLLFVSVQASTVTPNAHAHEAFAAGQTAMAATTNDVTIPVHDTNCDHGLPCCIGGQCAGHAYCITAVAAVLPSRSELDVAEPPSLAIAAGASSGIAKHELTLISQRTYVSAPDTSRGP
jgi:hypothetical protein